MGKYSQIQAQIQNTTSSHLSDIDRSANRDNRARSDDIEMAENRISRHSSVCISSAADSGDINNVINERLLSNNRNNRSTDRNPSFATARTNQGMYAHDSDTDEDYEADQRNIQHYYNNSNRLVQFHAHETSRADTGIEIWRSEGQQVYDRISIPEFALDSSFFDFLYAMYENEKPSRSSRTVNRDLPVSADYDNQRYTLVCECEYPFTEESTDDEAADNRMMEENELAHKVEDDFPADSQKPNLMTLQETENIDTQTDAHNTSSQTHDDWTHRQSSAIHDMMSVITNYQRRRRLLEKTSIRRGGRIDTRLTSGFNRRKTEFMDSQGLIWENRQQRARVIRSRMHTFGSYTHVYNSVASAMADVDCYLNPGKSNNTILAYRGFYTKPNLKLVHFQLRNVMTSFNERSIFYASSNPTDDSAFLSKLDVTTGQVTPVWVNKDDPWNSFKISTLTSKQNSYLAAGSFDGSIITYIPGTDQTSKFQISQGRNCIINYICVSAGQTEGTELAIASNDKKVCLFDLQSWEKTRDMSFSYPMNCVAQNPRNPNMLLLAGDSTEALVIDKREPSENSGLRLLNHKDYSFACDWGSDNLLATGNQDSTVRIYDDRNTSKPLHTISGYYHGAVRNLKFSGSGDSTCRYLAFAESIDNAYVVDLASGFKSEGGSPRYQHLSFFGKVAGLDFNLTDGGFNEDLSVAVADGCLGGIYRYKLDGFNYEGGMSEMTWI